MALDCESIDPHMPTATHSTASSITGLRRLALLLPVLLALTHISSADTLDTPPASKIIESASLSNWPQWRGPLANGTSPKADPPLRWSETNHVRWRTALPGKGHSSPVIWGDLIFLSAAVPLGEPGPPVYDNAPGTHDNLPSTQTNRFVLMAVSRRDGHIVWQRTVREDFPHEGGQRTGSLSSSSRSGARRFQSIDRAMPRHLRSPPRKNVSDREIWYGENVQMIRRK